MPAEILEEEGLQKVPNLELAQLKYFLSVNKGHEETRIKLMEAIKKDNMGPYYEAVCRELSLPLDKKLLETMKAVNCKEIAELEAGIVDAEANQGEMEVREANQKLAEYFSRIGDLEKALSQLKKTLGKTVTLGHRLDLTFHLIRLGLFSLDHDLVTQNIEKAKSLIEEGGDWDRRNRLKVYEGLYCMSIRQFKRAANLFLDTVSTFTSYELMDYPAFVTYAVFVSMLALPRNELREKVVRGSEILEVLHGLPQVKRFLMSLYNCHYGEFFVELAEVETFMKNNRYLHQHYRYYAREMRVLAYTQLLESYRSLTLQYMANSFGVSTGYVDKELARFISAGRLHCKIDRVGGIVETTRPDTNNSHYQATIKQGDVLLNRIQKLSRVINI